MHYGTKNPMWQQFWLLSWVFITKRSTIHTQKKFQFFTTTRDGLWWKLCTSVVQLAGAFCGKDKCTFSLPAFRWPLFLPWVEVRLSFPVAGLRNSLRASTLPRDPTGPPGLPSYYPSTNATQRWNTSQRQSHNGHTVHRQNSLAPICECV